MPFLALKQWTAMVTRMFFSIEPALTKLRLYQHLARRALSVLE